MNKNIYLVGDNIKLLKTLNKESVDLIYFDPPYNTGRDFYNFNDKFNSYEEYCEFIFPWLKKCMDYCNEKKICHGYNSRMPAFLAERFTSFWFNAFKKRSLLSYARLGNFHLWVMGVQRQFFLTAGS